MGLSILSPGLSILGGDAGGSVTPNVDEVDLTISAGGAITLPSVPKAQETIVNLTGQGDPDTLDSIVAGAAWIGRVVILKSASHTITCSDGTSMKLAAPNILNSQYDNCHLRCISANTFEEEGRTSPE